MPKVWQWYSEIVLPLLSSIEVKDISLTDYIQTRHAVYVPHTAGRYAKRQFKKAQMPIVERLVDR
jgi:small subunit ribosomal protein S5e